MTPPMRMAIVSDIHGNLTALEAVLRDVDQQQVDEVLIGGDLVEGGRQPTEVLDLLVARRWPAVVGNTDELVVNVVRGTADTSNAHYAGAVWAAGRLDSSHLEYLATLPASIRRSLPFGQELLLVHATPWSREEIVLLDAPEDQACRMFSQGQADVVAYGHIHAAHQRRIGNRWLISVGAVSGSNDQDPRATYSVLDLGPELAVEVRRVPYDKGI